ncbi:hypothetical protein B0T22DRAFT_207840 [Podospora appendiculata]|uniref:Uncharacterized protein n=1 Tax=Podospora appendiculata TaxID=314037 RepID=A0AAE0X4P4_9PEZI|nr:hypothetical protein B0T22DRAFT_207840 [Podospora appendiculata]
MASRELVGFSDLTAWELRHKLVQTAEEAYHILGINLRTWAAGQDLIERWAVDFMDSFHTAPIDSSQLRQLMYEIWWDHRHDSDHIREHIKTYYCDHVADSVIQYRVENLYWYYGLEEMPKMIQLWLNKAPDHFRWLGRNARQKKAWQRLYAHVPEGDERNRIQEVWHTYFAVQYYENMAYVAVRYPLRRPSETSVGFFSNIEGFIRQIVSPDEAMFLSLSHEARAAIGYYCFQAQFPKPDARALRQLFSVPPLHRRCMRNVKEGCCIDCDRELRVKRILAIVEADRKTRIRMREVEQAKKAALDRLQQELEGNIVPVKEESTVAVTCCMKRCSAHKKNAVHKH